MHKKEYEEAQNLLLWRNQRSDFVMGMYKFMKKSMMTIFILCLLCANTFQMFYIYYFTKSSCQNYGKYYSHVFTEDYIEDYEG